MINDIEVRDYRPVKEEKPKNENINKNESKKVSVLTVVISVICCVFACTLMLLFYNKFNPPVVINKTTITTDSTLASKNLTDTIATIQPCVVEIRAKLSNGISAGSGVIYSQKENTNIYQIITNYHVVQGAQKLYVTLRDGSTTLEAKFLGADVDNDISLIEVDTQTKLDEKLFKVATIGDSSTLKVGETAIVIGNPLGQLGGTVTTGIISALDRQIMVDGEPMTLLQTNAQINKGNSGGGLFNELGHLVGIVNAKSSGTGIEGIGFAIPINKASDSALQLYTNRNGQNLGYIEGQVKLAQSYLQVDETNYNQFIFNSAFSEFGVYINSMYKGSDIEKAGLHLADYIYMIDETLIETTKQVNEILAQKNVGDNIKISVKRYVNNERQLLNFDITLTQFVCQG